MKANLFTDLRPTLDATSVLRGQGIDPGQARPLVVEAAQSVVGEAQALLVPAALYTILRVRGFERQRVVLDGGTAFAGALVARALAGASEVALAVCTIGPALDERVGALFAAGDPVRAMALDGAGVAAVGEVSRMLGERLCDEAAARGLKVGMRVSPGQEGWALEEQRVLFSLIPAEKIAVQLTESCLMLPRKTVSFVVGLGPGMQADAVACDFCSKRERCRWRSR